MSVIACKIYKDGFIIGADSQMTTGNIFDIGKSKEGKKIYSVNNMVIGGVGDFDACCLMEIFAVNHRPVDTSCREALNFIVEFTKYKQTITNEYKMDNSFLIGFNSVVFYVEGFLVTNVNEFCAIGSGRQPAITALYLGHTIEESLNISCELDIYCARPLIIFDKRIKKNKMG